MDRARFEELVAEAVASLPQRFAQRLDNIDIQVRDWPTTEELRQARVAPGHLLLGLYSGVPRTRRSRGYNLVLPDRILIFQGPIEQVAHGEDAVRDRVRRTVLHEIAHHFGWSDVELAEMEGRQAH